MHTKERKLSPKRVGLEFKHQRRKRLIVGWFSFNFFFGLRVNTLHRRQIKRRREKIHHRIKHNLYTLIFKRRPRENRKNFVCNNGHAQHPLEIIYRNFLTLKKRGHKVVVVFNNFLHQFASVFFGISPEITFSPICPSKVKAFMVSKSMTPSCASSSPIGICMRTAFFERRSRILA